MPVRSLSASVFKWPDAREVNRAVRRWASQMMREHLEVVRIGYFGPMHGETGAWEATWTWLLW